MFNKELTHLLFPGIEEVKENGWRDKFINDRDLQVFVRSTTLSNEDLLKQLTHGQYVLWVDDVYAPFLKSGVGVKGNHDVVVWAKGYRTAIEAFRCLGAPKTMYIDYNLDNVYPPTTGTELLMTIDGYFSDLDNFRDIQVIPISSEKEMNIEISDLWEKLSR